MAEDENVLTLNGCSFLSCRLVTSCAPRLFNYRGRRLTCRCIGLTEIVANNRERKMAGEPTLFCWCHVVITTRCFTQHYLIQPRLTISTAHRQPVSDCDFLHRRDVLMNFIHILRPIRLRRRGGIRLAFPRPFIIHLSLEDDAEGAQRNPTTRELPNTRKWLQINSPPLPQQIDFPGWRSMIKALLVFIRRRRTLSEIASHSRCSVDRHTDELSPSFLLRTDMW